MFTIEYTKFFTKGLMSGKTFESKISYPTLEQAIEVAERMNSGVVFEAIGGSDYVCLYARIVAEKTA